ncbi:MAG: VWA domain-containing protein, partial [Pyrinomonadaceae bacterium]
MSRLLKVLCREATTRRRSVPALTLFVFAFVTAVPPTPRAAAQTLGARPRRVSDSRRHNSQATTKTTPTPAAQTRPQATPTPAIPSQQRQQQPPPVPVPTLQPQAGPGQLPADNSQAQDQAQEIEKDEIITVDTNLTTHNVRVIDRQNRPVNDVKQDEFRVFEDGVAQKIEYFSREEIPIQYGMVIDNSGSLRFQINQVIEAGKTIVNSNKPGDETFLVRFISSDKIETVQDFTGDQETLTEALDQLFVEGGQTAVIDAVMLSAERVANYRKGNDLDDRRRRALILVTDGEDRSSYYKQEDLF